MSFHSSSPGRRGFDEWLLGSWQGDSPSLLESHAGFARRSQSHQGCLLSNLQERTFVVGLGEVVYHRQPSLRTTVHESRRTLRSLRALRSLSWQPSLHDTVHESLRAVRSLRALRGLSLNLACFWEIYVSRVSKLRGLLQDLYPRKQVAKPSLVTD